MLRQPVGVPVRRAENAATPGLFKNLFNFRRDALRRLWRLCAVDCNLNYLLFGGCFVIVRSPGHPAPKLLQARALKTAHEFSLRVPRCLQIASPLHMASAWRRARRVPASRSPAAARRSQTFTKAHRDSRPFLRIPSEKFREILAAWRNRPSGNIGQCSPAPMAILASSASCNQ